MNVFALQIHENVGYDCFDDVFVFGSFDDLCSEFENKLNYYRNNGELRAIEEPTYDEATLEVHGMFKAMVGEIPVMAEVNKYEI